jgi:uncharacterized protein YmfQ (DUF2313 family)
MTDQWAPRGSDDYAQAFAALLPTGPAWPRDPESELQIVIAGMAEIWGVPPNRQEAETQVSVDGRAADLLVTEADPNTTIELLPDWETAFGLPDPCLAEPLTIEARHNALVNRYTMLGGASPEFFVTQATNIGYAIDVEEHSPYMCGISQVGDTRPTDPTAVSVNFRWELGDPTMRFYWTVLVLNPRLSWFRVGSGGGQVGVDPMLRIGIATDLECLIRRMQPAHGFVFFDYSGLVIGGALAGTP